MAKSEAMRLLYPPMGELDRVRERPRLMLHTGKETLVSQEFKDECDINFLMKKYKANGVIKQSLKPPFYGDFASIPDYQEAMNIVNEANTLFSSMSSDVRKRFDNDPAKFLEFCNNPDNGDELIKLGLREPPKPEPAPVKVEMVNVPAVEPEN